jgi:L-threonate 2-dehydrogenase
MDTTIGFIGLGAIGLGMCRNLLEAGFAVTGYDVRPEAVEALVEEGGERARSPAEAARGAGLLAVCVFDERQATEVLFGTGGAVASLPRGATVLMHTTMSPAGAEALETRLAETAHLLVDAPVTGGKAGADLGTLTVIGSGSDHAFAAATPVFEAIGRHVYRVGERAGAGSTVKMINQLLVGVHTVAAAEAVTLAVKAGADPQVVFDVISHGAGNSV